jgi:uncharacterized membrane protein YgdD (TMEM256/DUF423 family)
MINSPFLFIGSCFGFLSVAFGAFGAHALKAILDPSQLQVFQTAVLYQMFHAAALIGVGILFRLNHLGAFSASEKALAASGWCFFAGVIFFSGSLYALTLSGIKGFGAITPIGGVLFLVGWGILAFQSYLVWKA